MCAASTDSESTLEEPFDGETFAAMPFDMPLPFDEIDIIVGSGVSVDNVISGNCSRSVATAGSTGCASSSPTEPSTPAGSGAAGGLSGWRLPYSGVRLLKSASNEEVAWTGAVSCIDSSSIA